jgi:AcrR family transcriptional regulator
MIHTTFERLPQEKRDRIIQAARTEFIRYPYEKTSINRILAEAEVPKGSFYQYFDDKSDLFSLCTCAVYRKLIDARKRNGEPLLEFGMLRMKKLGYDKGYQAFSKDLERYLSEEDFKLFENMMEAPRHIRNYVQMNAASTLIAPELKEELERDKCVRTDIDYDYYAYLLSLTEVIPVDYGTRTGQKMEDFFFLGYQYMRSIYDSILQ